jgi:hypothetical protein
MYISPTTLLPRPCVRIGKKNESHKYFHRNITPKVRQCRELVALATQVARAASLLLKKALKKKYL